MDYTIVLYENIQHNGLLVNNYNVYMLYIN